MNAGKSVSERVEGLVLVLILLVVGVLAGAAAFTHVHDWTMDNSPTGTGDWFGWANAAISELIPLAALLTIRRRRRSGGPVGYPMFLLVAAVALSLSAQLAVAKPGPSGWLISAVPALAFLGLSKLVLGTNPSSPSSSSEPVTASSPTTEMPEPAVPHGSTVEDSEDESRPEPVPAQLTDQDDNQTAQDGDTNGQDVTVDLVQLARQRAAEHRATTGRPITRDELRAALRIANGTASELLRIVREADRPVLVPVPAAAFPVRNGTPVNQSTLSGSGVAR